VTPVVDSEPSGVVEVTKNALLRSNLLSAFPALTHGITGRLPGLGVADGNIGYSAPRDKADAWQMRINWCQAAGIDPESLVTVHQVHGATVRVATAAEAGRGARPGSDPLCQADAIITRDPGVALMTLHADCMPILLYDPATPAVASIHAGWRGTTLDVAGATVAAMEREFGSRPAELRAFLGAAIGRCCYEVGDEVVAAWRDQAGSEADAALEWGGTRWHLDLRAANRLLLARAGLQTSLVEASDVCTRCEPVDWFSHRGQGPLTGRFGALIALQEQG
jgi:YfiH family protein